MSVQDLAYEATVDARGGRPSDTESAESRDEAAVQAARQRAQWSERQGPRPTEGAGCTIDSFRVCSHQLLGYSANSAGARWEAQWTCGVNKPGAKVRGARGGWVNQTHHQHSVVYPDRDCLW